MIGEFKQRRFLSDERQPEVDFLHSSAVLLNKFLGKSSRAKKPSHTDLAASRHIKRDKASLPVDVRRPEKSVLPPSPSSDLEVPNIQ